MGKIIVNIESIDLFKTNFINSSNKLMELLEQIKSLSFDYSPIMESDASNRFKEILKEKLDSEIYTIGNNGKELENRINKVIETYNNTISKIKKSVGEL